MTNKKIDIDKAVDDFLFPLLETSESLALSNLTPVFSKDFMSNDFSDYILLKKWKTFKKTLTKLFHQVF